MIKRISIILLLISLSLLMIGCSNKYRKSYDEMNEKFIDAFSNEEDIDTFDISYLSAVNYNEKYYYVVKYTIDNNEEEYNLLYIFDKYGNTEYFFDISDLNNVYSSYQEQYNEYSEAYENGNFILFTQKEINKMIKDFYK